MIVDDLDLSAFTPRMQRDFRVLGTLLEQLRCMCCASGDPETSAVFMTLVLALFEYEDRMRSEAYTEALESGYSRGVAAQELLTRDHQFNGYILGVKRMCADYGVPIPDDVIKLEADVQEYRASVQRHIETGRFMDAPIDPDSLVM